MISVKPIRGAVEEVFDVLGVKGDYFKKHPISLHKELHSKYENATPCTQTAGYKDTNAKKGAGCTGMCCAKQISEKVERCMTCEYIGCTRTRLMVEEGKL